MSDGVAQRRLLGAFMQEMFVQTDLYDAAVGSQRLNLAVRQIARVIDQRAYRRMGCDNGQTALRQYVVKRALRRVRHVDHNAQSIHFGDHVVAERAKPAPFRMSHSRIADVVIVVMAQRYVRDA